MCDFHYVMRSLRLGEFIARSAAVKAIGGACSVVLLNLWLASPLCAQQIIELPGEDHWLTPDFEVVVRRLVGW